MRARRRARARADAREDARAASREDAVTFLTTDEWRTVFGARGDDASSDARVVAVTSVATQTRAWDCGYACARAVVDALAGEGREGGRGEGGARAGRAGRGGAWTIDLARAVRERGCERVVMVTTSTGARAAYGGMGFYADDFLRECARVNGSFARALRGDFDGLEVYRRRMTSEDVDRVLSGGSFACIALVCRRRLRGMGTDGADDFVGHFVVLAASPNASSFRVLDPARHDGGEYEVSFDVFDHARTAFGTDEDLLFVSTRLSDFNKERWARARTRFASAASAA